jgi:hypothetical protein
MTMNTVIQAVAVETGNQTWTVGSGGDGFVYLTATYDDPEWNDDYVFLADDAEKIGRELIAAAKKAKPRKRYRMI